LLSLSLTLIIRPPFPGTIQRISVKLHRRQPPAPTPRSSSPARATWCSAGMPEAPECPSSSCPSPPVCPCVVSVALDPSTVSTPSISVELRAARHRACL
jgi:hypothetical protein